MSKSLNQYKEQIKEGQLEEAIQGLKEYINTHNVLNEDEPFYLLGNAYRKLGNWQLALNNYLEAKERNSESPAVQAYQMTMDILNFYNKDMYNQ